MSLGARFEEVLKAAQAGGEWAISLLYRDLQPKVLAYLRSRDPGEAEDLASEVWLGVASALAKFEGDEDAFAGWVFTIANRRLTDALRKTSRRRTEPVDPAHLASERASGDTESEVVGVAAALEALERIRRVLTPDQADAVALRVVAGLSVEQTAVVMGKRPGTIRVLQHRALQRLASALQMSNL